MLALYGICVGVHFHGPVAPRHQDVKLQATIEAPPPRAAAPATARLNTKDPTLAIPLDLPHKLKVCGPPNHASAAPRAVQPRRRSPMEPIAAWSRKMYPSQLAPSAAGPAGAAIGLGRVQEARDGHGHGPPPAGRVAARARPRRRHRVEPRVRDAPLRQPVAGLAVVAAAVATANRPPRPLVLLLPPVMRALAPTPLRSWPAPLPGVGAYRMRP